MLEENTIEHLNYSLLAQDFDPLFELLDSLPQNVPVFILNSILVIFYIGKISQDTLKKRKATGLFKSSRG